MASATLYRLTLAFPGGPVVKTWPSKAGVWVRSLVGELRSHMTRGMAQNNQTNKQGCRGTQTMYLTRLTHVGCAHSLMAVTDSRSWEGRERKIRAQVEGRETIMVQGAEYGLGFYRKGKKGWQTKVSPETVQQEKMRGWRPQAKEGGGPSLRCPHCLHRGLARGRCSTGNC